MENKSIYDQLDEINEKQDEILEAVNHRTPLNRNATVNIDLTKATIAACESIVKNAIRDWRYQGEKSDFRRETHQIKRRGILLIIILLIQIIVPFFLIAEPYYWIFATINAIICVGYAVYAGYRFFRKREYEEPYGRKCEFWQRNDYDDNGVAIITEDKLLFKLFKILALIIMPLMSITLSLFSSSFPLKLIIMMLLAVLMPLAANLQSSLGYILYFIDGENQVPYDHLKGFMKKNNLK